jgi:hypothetical protein
MSTIISAPRPGLGAHRHGELPVVVVEMVVVETKVQTPACRGAD